MRLVSASGLSLWVMMLPPMISAQLAPPASAGGPADATYERRYADLLKSEIDLPLMPAKPRSIRSNDLEGVLAEVKMEDWGK